MWPVEKIMTSWTIASLKDSCIPFIPASCCSICATCLIILALFHPLYRQQPPPSVLTFFCKMSSLRQLKYKNGRKSMLVKKEQTIIFRRCDSYLQSETTNHWPLVIWHTDRGRCWEMLSHLKIVSKLYLRPPRSISASKHGLPHISHKHPHTALCHDIYVIFIILSPQTECLAQFFSHKMYKLFTKIFH